MSTTPHMTTWLEALREEARGLAEIAPHAARTIRNAADEIEREWVALVNEKRRPDDWQDALVTRCNARAEAAEAQVERVREVADALTIAAKIERMGERPRSAKLIEAIQSDLRAALDGGQR